MTPLDKIQHDGKEGPVRKSQFRMRGLKMFADPGIGMPDDESVVILWLCVGGDVPIYQKRIKWLYQ